MYSLKLYSITSSNPETLFMISMMMRAMKTHSTSITTLFKINWMGIWMSYFRFLLRLSSILQGQLPLLSRFHYWICRTWRSYFRIRRYPLTIISAAISSPLARTWQNLALKSSSLSIKFWIFCSTKRKSSENLVEFHFHKGNISHLLLTRNFDLMVGSLSGCRTLWKEPSWILCLL